MAKYKVGDKVRVRRDIKVGKMYGSMSFLNSMRKCIGKVVTIKKWCNCSYEIEENHDPYWTDEMFEGLAEETSRAFKVGDRVIATDNCEYYKEKPGTIVDLWRDMTHPTPYGVEFDEEDGSKSPRLWSKVHRLIKAEPTPTPVVNVNVTVNLYENACWYCRKGGLVDLYLAGAMGICPSCGRVCNNTTPTKTKKESIVIEFKPKEPKENKPLTTEELKALPKGTRVFSVWLDGHKKPRPHDCRTCWRTVVEDGLDRKTGGVGFSSNGSSYYAYLEMPEGYVDNDP